MGDRSAAGAHGAAGAPVKRPRARMDTTTPNKKSRLRRRRLSASSAGLLHSRSGSDSSDLRSDLASGESETKIVWKDSPVEKQIKVSGTGKLAVRKEMQGFVGRLARASVESSHTGADTGDDTSSPRDDHSREHLFSHTFTKRKTAASRAAASQGAASSGAVDSSRTASSGINRGANALDAGAATSRHLVFSPDTAAAAGGHRRHTGTPPRHTTQQQLQFPVAAAAAVAGRQGHGQTPLPTITDLSSPATKSDAQDELLMILDKIDEKYSSQEGSGLPGTSPLQRTPVTVTPPPRVPTAPEHTTVAAAAVTPPPLHRSRVPPSATTASSSSIAAGSGAVSSARSLQYAMTPEKQVASAAGVTESLECGSPLTEESWDLLDQLELQATQRIADSQDVVIGSSQSLEQQQVPPTASSRAPSLSTNASAARPVSSVTSLRPSPVAAADVAAVTTASSRAPSQAQQQQQGTEADGYKRYLVLEVECDVYHRRLHLRLLDAHDAHVDAVLADDWFDTSVEAGDTINIVFTERDRSSGLFSQDVSSHSSHPPPPPQVIPVDNERNIVILHPDVLVSPTNVTTSFRCLRRAVLRETLSVSRATHPAALLGTLKHDLFETALVQSDRSTEFLVREAERIVQSNIIGLVESGLSEDKALLELKGVISDYQTWLHHATSASGVQLNEPPPATGASVRVHRVLATEEMMWSIKWGLKGATDASVDATFLSRQPQPRSERVVLPIELKTGSKTYSGTEHHGQVTLYTLLLNERYRQACPSGLLLYAPGIETNRIAALATHVRGLVLERNKVASAMAKVKALGSATASQVFPPMLRQQRECSRCFQVDECVLHHAAVENGSRESSGLDELFTTKLAHLSETDLAYFKHWHRLIALEQQHAEKNLRALWLQVGWKREQDLGNSTCIASLRLVLNEPALSNRGASRLLRFQRDPRRLAMQPPLLPLVELGFRADDRIILSAESLDGTKLLVHVARGKVLGLDATSIAVEVHQAIPSIVLQGQSAVGANFTWRLDKDAIMTGLSRAKENLVLLFIGPAPEAITVGTNPTSRPELTALRPVSDRSAEPSNAGDTRRRHQIVHLARPRFKTCRVHDVVAQRRQRFAHSRDAHAVEERASRLLDAFARLNVDQQRAVHKVVSALDYALVLGMPGTGKTSTIAFTVQLLLFLGHSVLVTSYTHSAVDNLLLKLVDADVPMLRIGAPSQVHPLLAPATLEQQAAAQRVDSVARMEALMLEAQLVGCTCLSVSSHVLFRKRRFDYCIVDEATQTTQPVVLGALRCADTFVLVGDHYQLPPLVASAQARKDGMDVSLFRRLSEAHPVAVQQLSFQYRMNADIMCVANRLVYGGKLKCGSCHVASNHLRVHSDAKQPQQQCAWPWTVLSNGKGVVFLDTDRVEGTSESVAVGPATPPQQQPTGRTGRRRMENAVEARLVVGLVQVLVRSGVRADEVAVISPFRSQVALIARDLAASASGAVEVSTIDKYQGKDKDVVIVSFVRSNAEHHVGELLTDWRRINVALTRARQKLVLVGSLRTLSGGSPLFSVLADVVRERQWQFPLAPDALRVLDGVVRDVRKQPAPSNSPTRRRSEPEPEQDASTHSSGEDAYAEVSVLHPSDDNDDIEGLVPNISSVSSLRRRAPATSHDVRTRRGALAGPIVRDVSGEL